MAIGRGCVWELLCDETLLVTFCDEVGTSEQWRTYIAMMRKFQGRAATRLLVYADAVPPGHVLGEIASVARGQTWRVALICPSTAVRVAASTFAFVVRNFRFFPPDQLDAALLHLRCDAAQKELASRALMRLRGP